MGVVNVPIIYFLGEVVEHPAPGRVGVPDQAPTMATTMLWGMLLMALAFWMYSIAIALTGCGRSSRARTTRHLGGRTAGDAAMNWGSASEFFSDGRLRSLRLGSFGVTAAALLIEETLVRRRLTPPRCVGN